MTMSPVPHHGGHDQGAGRAYEDLVIRERVCRAANRYPDSHSGAGLTYQWGTMEGGSTRGYFAIRMKSDIMYEREYGGVAFMKDTASSRGFIVA